jgi:uncharacterized protein YuzE
MAEKRISIAVSEDDQDVAYLYLPDHPGRGTSGVVVKQVRLSSLLKYAGPDLNLDFDEHGQLIGVEILA